MDHYARPNEIPKQEVDHVTRLKGESQMAFNKGEHILRRQIGIESEYALVSTNSNPTRFGHSILIDEMRNLFSKMGSIGGWSTGSEEMTLNRKVNGGELVIGTDLGHGTLEIGMPPKTRLSDAKAELTELMRFISSAAEECEMMVLGYGVQPLSAGTKALAMPRPRYDRLEIYFGSNLFWHTINAAAQLHTDVSKEEAMPVHNTLNAYAPAMIAITGNSRVSNGIDTGFNDIRNTFWNRLVEGKPDDATRVGIAPKFKDYNEYFDATVAFKPLLTIRDSEFLAFANGENFKEYLVRGHTHADVMGNGRGGMSIKIKPELNDFFALQSTIYTDARIQSKYGTVEFRPCSQQPSIESNIAISATVLGLVSNLDEAHERIARLSMDVLRTSRRNATKHGLYAFMGNEPMRSFSKDMLDISKEGLQKIGEDPAHLDVFYDRVKTGRNPADESIGVLRKEGLNQFINHIKLRV